MFLFLKNAWLFSSNVVLIFCRKSRLLFASEFERLNGARDRLQFHKFINTSTENINSQPIPIS